MINTHAHVAVSLQILDEYHKHMHTLLWFYKILNEYHTKNTWFKQDPIMSNAHVAVIL